MTNTSDTASNGIMFWGCIGYHGVGELVEVTQTMNSVNFVNLLDENLLDSIENIFGDRRKNFILQ